MATCECETSPSDRKTVKWAWPYVGFKRDVGSMA